MNFIDPVGEAELANWFHKTGNRIPGVLTVGGHGHPDGFLNRVRGNEIAPVELAKLIKAHPRYDQADYILLSSCNTGSKSNYGDNYAQRLSNALGKRVYAPNGYFIIGSSGASRINKSSNGMGEEGSYLPFDPKLPQERKAIW